MLSPFLVDQLVCGGFRTVHGRFTKLTPILSLWLLQIICISVISARSKGASLYIVDLFLSSLTNWNGEFPMPTPHTLPVAFNPSTGQRDINHFATAVTGQ